MLLIFNIVIFFEVYGIFERDSNKDKLYGIIILKLVILLFDVVIFYRK